MDGLLLLDKPRGISSNSALQHARHLLNAAKAGHTGTLDPLACGLLPLCFGEATKFAQALLDSRKEYVTTIHFGVSTTTGDVEGEIVREGPVGFERDALKDALAQFIGTSQQVPPRYAALKHEGRSYYEYARKGVEIPRPARSINVDVLELLEFERPNAVIRIGCSKGTYIRALAEDIAASLGTFAHLSLLRRTQSGPFFVDDAVTMEAFEAMSEDRRLAQLLPIDAPLADMPVLALDAIAARALAEGRATAAPSEVSGRRRAYGPQGFFLGIVEGIEGTVRPVRLVDTTVHANW